ncbi:MAG: hypothetical protein AVDCRST_MAG66-4287, partial [uncultured Pseudonocardia sp.]
CHPWLQNQVAIRGRRRRTTSPGSSSRTRPSAGSSRSPPWSATAPTGSFPIRRSRATSGRVPR